MAIELDLDTDAVLFYYEDYLRLLKMDWLIKIYKDLKNDFPPFIYLYKRIKKRGLEQTWHYSFGKKSTRHQIYGAPSWFVQWLYQKTDIAKAAIRTRDW